MSALRLESDRRRVVGVSQSRWAFCGTNRLFASWNADPLGIIVPDDPAATWANILSHLPQYRAALATDLASTAPRRSIGISLSPLQLRRVALFS